MLGPTRRDRRHRLLDALLERFHGLAGVEREPAVGHALAVADHPDVEVDGVGVGGVQRRGRYVELRLELARLRIDVLYEGFQCEGYELAPDAALIAGLAGAAARANGHAPPLFASTATTDARTFQLYGDTPAVCFGPVAENEHGVDERVHLPSVTSTAQAIALFIADWCGLEETE